MYLTQFEREERAAVRVGRSTFVGVCWCLMEGVRLPDGRRVGVTESGDPNGAPLVFCHGFTGSRLQLHPDPSIASELGFAWWHSTGQIRAKDGTSSQRPTND